MVSFSCFPSVPRAAALTPGASPGLASAEELLVPPMLCHLRRFAVRGHQFPSSCGAVFSSQAPEGAWVQPGLSPAPESSLCSQNSF